MKLAFALNEIPLKLKTLQHTLMADLSYLGGLFDIGDVKQEVAFRFAVNRINAPRSPFRRNSRSRLETMIEKIPPFDSFHASKRGNQGFPSCVNDRMRISASFSSTFFVSPGETKMFYFLLLIYWDQEAIRCEGQIALFFQTCLIYCIQKLYNKLKTKKKNIEIYLQYLMKARR